MKLLPWKPWKWLLTCFKVLVGAMIGGVLYAVAMFFFLAMTSGLMAPRGTPDTDIAAFHRLFWIEFATASALGGCVLGAFDSICGIWQRRNKGTNRERCVKTEMEQ